MYLISQLWSYLALAFLLGALLGYLLWRWCGRPRLESQYDRQRKDLTARLGLMEQERSKFTGAAMQAEAENAKLRSELSGLRTAAGDASTKASLFHEADEKLKVELANVKQRVTGLSGEAERHQKDLSDARKAFETERAAAKVREDKLAADLAAVKRASDEASRTHNNDLRKAHEQAVSDAAKKHADELSRTRAELADKHADEIKKAHDTAKHHEAKVQSLMRADTGAKKEIEEANARHAAELKKAQEHAASEAAKKHSDELAKARAASEEAVRKHADELGKARATAEDATRKHVEELKKAHETAKQHEAKVHSLIQADGGAKKEIEDAKARHAAELKKAQEHAVAEAAKKHADELNRTRSELAAKHADELKKAHDAAKHHEAKVLALTQADTHSKKEIEDAKARHAAELKKAQEHASTEAAKKHADELAKAHAAAEEALRRNTDDGKKAREAALSEAHAKHIQELKAAREATVAEATKKHADELNRARAELAAKHADELKKAHETAKQHEAKVVMLTQADTGAKKEIEEAKARHAMELKKAQEHAVAEATKKHADELNRARAELAAKHAEELKKAHDAAKHHEAKVLALTQADTHSKKEIEDAKARHAAELKKAQEHASTEAAKKHADELAKAHAAAEEALRRNTDDGKKAREAALSEAHGKHIQELKAARESAVAEAAKHHAEEIARIKSQADAAAHKHAEDLKTARNAASAAVSAAALKETPSVRAEPHAPAAAPAASAPAPATAQGGYRPNLLTAPKGGKADDLKLIWGVGPEIEKLLNKQGIHHFDQLAHWNDKDVAWFDALLPEFHGRAVREKWVEQSMKLATGWRPEREIGDKPKDLLTAARGGKADDLKLIWGVGPKLEQTLNKAGIYHFSQIASWTDREIEWVDSQMGDFAGRAVRDKWIEQCKKLVSGWRPSSDVGEKPH